MITIQREIFMQTLGELKPILDLHYEELALNKDKVPLDPCYELYDFQESAGKLLFVTVRDDGELVGYFIGFVQPGLHYRTCLTCIMDIFFIEPGARGAAMLGLKLFRAVEVHLKEMGVQRWVMGSKKHRDASALFERIGAEPIETMFSKWIGE